MKSMFPLTLAAVVSAMLMTSSPARATSTDSRIESSAAKSYVVMLEGEAGSLAERKLTTAYAQDIDNVVLVQNNIKVAQTPVSPAATVGEMIDDASITAEVKSSLLSHYSTSAVHVAVSM